MATYIEDRSSSELFISGSLDSFVPVNSLARLLWRVLEGLCFERFDAVYRNDAAGRPAIDPRRLVGAWVLGLVRGVTSSTSLAVLCGRDVEFRWILGDAPVHKSTLSAFRTAHGEALNDLCAQVLGALGRSNLLPGESLSLDGTVIRAAASCHAVRSRKKLQRRIERLREVIAEKMAVGASGGVPSGEAEEAAIAERHERLQAALLDLESLGAKEHLTTSEPEAALMKLKNGAFAPAYNVQVTADLETGAIVCAQIVAQGNDAGQLLPQVENAKRALANVHAQDTVKTVVADSAYHDTQQLRALEEQHIACVVPQNRSANRLPKGVAKAFHASAFTHDAASGTMLCPAGQTLERRKMNNDKTAIVYQAKTETCAACPHKPACCPNTQHGRSVNRTAYPEIIGAVRARVRSEHGQALLRARWTTAEGIFARITELLSMHRLRARGTKGAEAEVGLRVFAHNVMLLTGAWRPMVYQPAKAA